MRRIVLIVIIAAILAALVGGGVWYYLRQNSPAKLLARSELALRGKQFDRALELAIAAAEKDPEAWEPYYRQARAYLAMGRYDEARRALDEADKRQAPPVAVAILRSETYATPGKRALSQEATMRQSGALVEAIGQIRQANTVLQQIQATEPRDIADVRQALGMNLVQMGWAERALAWQYVREAQTAETARDLKKGKDLRDASEKAQGESDRLFDEATAVLLDVVRQDATREMPARTLVELALGRRDDKTLQEAKNIILAHESPAPVAAALLTMYDLRDTEELRPSDKDKARLEEAAKRLEALIQRHPDAHEVKLAGAVVALRLGDMAKTLALVQGKPIDPSQPPPEKPYQDKARALCQEILDAKPPQEYQLRARLTIAGILMRQGHWAEAEREYYAIKTEAPSLAEAHYRYALAAQSTGKSELAREAMRTVTKLDPTHAGARSYLARSLLASGFAAEAFPDAKALYEAHPDQPSAVSLFVRAAVGTKQESLARQAIEKAVKDYGKQPDMLMAAYEAYLVLGDRDKALDVARLAADAKAENVAQRLAVARAMGVQRRMAEAETILGDELKNLPGDARVPYELGRLYEVTGRRRQAIEQYRTAVRLDPGTGDYRLALASALFDEGILDQAEAEAQIILQNDPTQNQARILVAEIRLLQGELKTEDMLETLGGGARATVLVALEYLYRGNPQAAVDLCLQQLKADPENRQLRVVLAEAYMRLGQTDKGIEQSSILIKQAPDRLPSYQQLADALSRTNKPEDVEKILAAIPGARRELVDLALGGLLDRVRLFKSAAEVYGRVVARPDLGPDLRTRARVLRAQSLARAGQPDRALAELEPLVTDKTWRDQALYSKAVLLAADNRAAEAETILADLQKRAVQGRDTLLLERLCGPYVQMKQFDKALAICDELQKLLPNDVRSYLVRADVLGYAGRQAEMIECFRQAAQQQPGNLRVWIRLAQALESNQKCPEALQALHELSRQGQTGRVAALYEQGNAYVRWGLQAEAAQCFEQLLKLGFDDDSVIQMAVGQAFARLGQKDRARECLKRVREYTSQYIEAQLLLVDLEDRDEGKLAILREVRKKNPNNLGLVVQEMRILLKANRTDEITQLYQNLLKEQQSGALLPDVLTFLASQAYLTGNNVVGATDLARRTAEKGAQPRWRQTAILLMPDDKPEDALKLLPPPDRAEPYDAVLGLVLASRAGQPMDPWKKRLAEIQDALARMQPPQSLPGPYRVLIALITGSKGEAEALMAKYTEVTGAGRHAALELIAASANPKVAAEPGQLLEATLALDLGIPLAARARAMRILKARPTSQWAAGLIVQTRPEPAVVREVIQTLQPPDCLLARMLLANLAQDEKQYDKATEIWRQAAAESNDPEFLVNQAAALERANKPAEALPLYRQVWQATKNTIAGNNAAYLLTVLYPKDAACLAEALQIAEAVVQVSPAVSAFRDTLGWAMLLNGRNDEALAELRRAVRAMPDSPEVHYHLGRAETVAGSKDLARSHLSAAVALGERLKAEGNLPDAAEAAARAAREALAALDKT